MKVHVQKLGNISILRLRGEIVIGETNVLSRSVTAQNDSNAVVLDFARVSRIDAAGLGVLLQLREQAESTGLEFRIMNVTRLIQQVLDITKLNRVFEVTCERNLPYLTTRVAHESVQPARVEHSFSDTSEPDVTEAAFAFDASTSRS